MPVSTRDCQENHYQAVSVPFKSTLMSPWKSFIIGTLLASTGASTSFAFQQFHPSNNVSPRLLSSSSRIFPRLDFGSTTSPLISSKKLSSTALFHMGHSHSHHHHHHHHHENNDERRDVFSGNHNATKEQTKLTTKWIRRLALWLCCWMATCGITLLKHKKLSTQDWLAFGVSSLVVSSAQKMQRAFTKGMLRLQKLKEGVVKHSSFPQVINNANGKSTTAQAVAAIRNTEEADRVTWMGVIINLLLSIGKLVVGIAQNSSVLIADAGHSLSDLVSDFITLWSVNVARLPPDDDHPYGHYKFEAIGSLFLSLTLLMTGISVGLHSQKQLLAVLKTSHGITSTAALAAVPSPGPLALFMAGISILSKEWLFRVTKVVGEKLNSPVVIANAWHHRSDAYSSILALLSIMWSMAGFPAADAAAGMLVAGMIGMTGGDILVESVKQLSDSAHEELHQEVVSILESLQDDDVLSTTSIRARQVGSASVAEVTVEVELDLTTTATRVVEERIQQHLQRELLKGNQGRSVVATVHAKPNLIICPLLHQTSTESRGMHAHTTISNSKLDGNATLNPIDISHDDEQASTTILSVSASETIVSASQIEHEVRQQALLLYPKIHCQVTGVTVHFSSQNTVSVDCNIWLDQHGDENFPPKEESPLTSILACAKELQTALETNVQVIESASIYLDLNQMAKSDNISSRQPLLGSFP
ncbi:cation efflux family-domain containing protein [Nitzschia inconspicua]|uniref:Cation efflux family-domain containing protein n=1 Tax=Nitzschia inconspicua TaxID=303405 RepID=A0A9K3PUK3_9STRA|nr:cation efflux family-domain containing protein [Nitzschia inconspicua]